MRCQECPYSLACVAGRFRELFNRLAQCPDCGRLVCVLRPLVEKVKPASLQALTPVEDKVRYRQEFLGVFEPLPQTTIALFLCEKRPLGIKQQLKWRSVRQAAEARFDRGWPTADPAIRGGELLMAPCPECSHWPTHEIIEDLDARETYEIEKRESTPAFRLRGPKDNDR